MNKKSRTNRPAFLFDGFQKYSHSKKPKLELYILRLQVFLFEWQVYSEDLVH